MDKNIKPDESRLLNAEEFTECAQNTPVPITEVEKCAEPWVFGANLIKAQDIKTASIKDQECQQKLKGMKEKIEERAEETVTEYDWWEALWKVELER